MNRKGGFLLGPKREVGQVIPMAAVMMVGLLGIAALAVDLGYLFVTRNDLQNVSDAGALAGTRALGHIYQGLSYEEQTGYVCDGGCSAIVKTAAMDVVELNQAGGLSMTVLLEEVIIGQWDGDNFTKTNISPDAVHVIARRDEVVNGPVSTFFARVLGIDEASVTAEATAALTGQSTKNKGEIELPIGISRWFFRDPNQSWCDEDIQFYPTNDPASCAGWTSWDYGSNDLTLRRILEETGGYESPVTIADETIFNFTGGTLSTLTFDALLDLYQTYGFDTDANYNYLLKTQYDITSKVNQADSSRTYWTVETVDENEVWTGGVYPEPLIEYDNQGNPVRGEYTNGTLRNLHKWETSVPVYDRDDCSNPNQSILIVGFAPIELRDVLNSPDKLVRGTVKCDYIDPLASRGGGGSYGIKGSVPGLVR